MQLNCEENHNDKLLGLEAIKISNLRKLPVSSVSLQHLTAASSSLPVLKHESPRVPAEITAL